MTMNQASWVPADEPADELSAIVADIRGRVPPGGQMVFISGDFNILHPGHLRLFNFAASCGDFLVVGLHGDGLGNTLVPEHLRLESVKAIGVVNHALVLHVQPDVFIARLQPHFVVKGSEHRKHYNLEQGIIEAYGGKLLFCSGDSVFSSLDLLRRSLQETNFDTIQLPDDYPSRHGFDTSSLISVVQKFSGLKVLVLGDLIVDEYVDCDALGMSREDPTLVVTPLLSDKFVGGAAIVAAHARGLGSQVSYFGICGNDGVREFAEKKLQAYGVTSHLLVDKTRPTTLKQRYRVNGKTLLRVSHLRQHLIDSDLMDAMMAQIELAIDGTDLVLFSDFNYGCLPQPLVDRVTELAAKRGIMMAADSQTSSQMGDVSRFQGMTLLTPTEHEARMALRDNQSGLVVLADNLKGKADAANVIITLAGEGILIHSPDTGGGLITDRLPAFNMAPQDVSGAGDSLFTCTTLAMALGENIWLSAYLGSVAAACQVGRLGNLPLTAREILEELNK